MKKYLFIQDHLYGGGAEQICIDTAVALKEKGHDVTVLLLDSNNIRTTYPEDLNLIKFDITPAFMRGSIKKNKLKSVPLEQQAELIQIINDLAPDTIIAGHSHAFWLSPILTGNVWFWVHGDTLGLVRKQNLGFFKYLEALKKFTQCKKSCNYLFKGKQLIVVNQDIKNLIQQHIQETTVKVIHNGINVKRLKSNLPDDKNVIIKKWNTIFVGRLSEEKQPDVAIKAFAESGLTGRMAIVGDEPLLDELIRLTETLGLTNRIDFLGWQTQPNQFIEQSNSLILTSRSEGFGLTIAEALILNIPVVAYNCSEGVEHQLSSGELIQGLVTLNDMQALSRRLYQVVTHPYEIRAQDIQRLNISEMVKAFEEL
ncbi:glycosyltransferase [Acinetobacter pittii]|uniref:glycosyltransferase n=1 Tax=Acinetobacter pittii TaxID=48296 RepID=UPI0024DEDDFA|nr:glycosyltransferase [Acinetobacter pittii]